MTNTCLVYAYMFDGLLLRVFIFVWRLWPRPLEPDLMGSVQHGSAVLESEGSGEEGHRLSASGSKLRSSPHEGTSDLITVLVNIN